MPHSLRIMVACLIVCVVGVGVGSVHGFVVAFVAASVGFLAFGFYVHGVARTAYRRDTYVASRDEFPWCDS